MERFSLSANVEAGTAGNDSYIVTPNVSHVASEIVNQYHVGIHSFSIIGAYGTGKSCFLVNFLHDLHAPKAKRKVLANPKAIAPVAGFKALTITGAYRSLEQTLLQHLGTEGFDKEEDCITSLKSLYSRCKREAKMLVIVVDEFGKALEHAAKCNPEEELYFMQRLAEFANHPQRNVLLITVLHQNFGAYAAKLNAAQRNEWAKVKGRFHEVVFAEPVEQLLHMAAEAMHNDDTSHAGEVAEIHRLALATKFIAPTFGTQLAQRLFPLDVFAAVTLTKAIQRYGQNERSLFSFVASGGSNSIRQVQGRFYGLCDVYHYIVNAFHSHLSEANTDASGWAAIQTAMERVETAQWADEGQMRCALQVVKAIGLLNLFGQAGFTMTARQLACYIELTTGQSHAEETIKELERKRIIRYAEYRQRHILFEGTDVNIEEEIAKATTAVPAPVRPIDDLRVSFYSRVAPVKAYYYHRGTPRYFEYTLLDAPLDTIPTGDTDGYIQLIFSNHPKALEQTTAFSAQCGHAIVFACFVHTESIVSHLHKVMIYNHILEKVLIDKSDRVALREIVQLKGHEQSLLNKELTESLFSYGENVEWIYRGKEEKVRSLRDFNRLLSRVCDDVYPLTPTLHNELFNRHKLSGTISAARVKYLQALTSETTEDDLGFEAGKFPPEKTIFHTLLKETGLYKDGAFTDAPTSKGIAPLWQACEDFMQSTQEKGRKVSELIKLLSSQPYKMKQGVLDFWIPTYLYLKRQDYSLFGSNGAYIPQVNMEFFELLKKHPSEFAVKAFATDGVKMQFFNQYRKFINASGETGIKGDKFIETVRPFFFFYNHLNPYAKQTRKFDHVATLKFRDVLAKAKDPEKTFFEDLPEALGYDRRKLDHEDFVANYCSLIQRAVRELRSCYRSLIDRIELRLVEGLKLSSYDYHDYIHEIRQRLGRIKPQLLTDKQTDFFNHAIAEFDSRDEWYQSVCYAALDHPLERLRDEQEEQLTENLVYLFKECEKCAVVSEAMDYSIGEKDEPRAKALEEKIENVLTGDANLDIHTLMRLLKRKMRQ